MKRYRKPRRKVVKRMMRKQAKKPIEQPVKASLRRPKKHILLPIEQIARSLGINKKYVEMHGPYKAKISLDLLRLLKKKKTGKYILLTSITPTPLGEGKTVTAIGLSMAFKRLRKKAISCIPQPALSGVFGMKGTGTGGGFSQVFPREDTNLNMTGDTGGVEAAHNLCAAYLDNSIFNGNPFDIAVETITWRRVANVNDRVLRNINVGLGGKIDGVPRKTGFSLTGSSELMAILALSNGIKDMRERIGKIILGFTKKGKPVTCEDIKAAGAMTVLLKEAIKPNLLQTSEGTACLMHTCPFGNTSIGSSSVIADRIALALSDYAITETGFGAELGAEKFFDIKCRTSGLKPDACVIVCSVRALKMHSGDFEITAAKMPRDIARENISAVERGISNLEKQMENLANFGVPVVVCINRFRDDTEKEIQTVRRRAMELGAAGVAVSEVWSRGGEGGEELAKAVMEACKIKSSFRFLYPTDMLVRDKIRRIARTLYGAKDVTFSDAVNNKALLYKKLKIDNLPVCVVKTQLSLSQKPERKGRPHGFKFPVEDIRVNAGAGYIDAVSENIKTMPGLPKVPRGTKIDIDEDGNVTGLF